MDKIALKHFEDYQIGSYDEMFYEDGTIKEHWGTLASHIHSLNEKGLSQKQFEIDWQLKENGVTYNIYTDKQTRRKWNLDPIPFILKNDEWCSLKEGIIQRAKLLDLIFKDIYREQKLLQEGIIPAEIFYLDPHFIREVQNFNQNYFQLHYYGIDVSRGPDGKFWIISDKVESPSGLGYAIENRLTLNSVNKDLIQNIKIHRIAQFIEGFKQTLLERSNSLDPFIVMLSPGPYNETYFEQSYLSSILNCELVQGEDLLVKDANLYLKNLTGLKKIDIVIRRVDDKFCDPLELKNDSQLGVPGLLDVLRQENVVMINPIGIGILENPALNPFMNNICEYFLNEPLLIPQIATWWCGQEKEKNYVFEHLDELIIKSVDKTIPQNIYVCSQLNPAQKAVLKSKIEKNPYMFIAQEKIEFSTTPSLVGKNIEARKNSLRLFCYKNNEEYHVMNGGLVRISSEKDTYIVSNQKGGGSKDLWILTDTDEPMVSPISNDLISYNEFSIASLTTKKAENIFWLGRYLQRSIITARTIRLYLKYLMNNHRSENINAIIYSLDLYAKALTHLTMTYPGFLNEKVNVSKELNSILKDNYRMGSLPFTLSMLENVNINIKSLLSNECSKVFDKLESNWFNHSNSKKTNYTEHAEALDDLLIYLSAYKELIQESISQEQGLIFYEIGSKLEMAILFISKIRSLMTLKHKKHIEYELLQFLLHSYEGFKTYKSLYKSNITIERMVDFLLFQKNYPKSLLSIIRSIINLLESIAQEENIKSRIDGSEKYMYEIYTKLQSVKQETLLVGCDDEYIYCELDSFLSEITSSLIKFSDEFTKNYFSHYYE
ncbi:circularly permuted type 2 ATP-grasp protein [Sulfurimonas sp.]|uniref:circularly permuted type 2 ATP-grasp protein n=1 Tax=Sulfurimonas sp. TaxID=2022749 RepID=UPI003D124C4F